VDALKCNVVNVKFTKWENGKGRRKEGVIKGIKKFKFG
jgi:hypothetical protein